MRTSGFILGIGVTGLLCCGSASAGLSYLDPVGGWTYVYTGDSAAPGLGTGFDALDGTWSHNNGSDEWDGSVVGAGRPGGVSALGGYARLQDTGDPRDYGFADPGSNRKLAFAHSITGDIGAPAAANILDGVTLSFRSRVAVGPPLDDALPDGGGGIFPWPAGGDGYVTHSGGQGNFGVFGPTGEIISFALTMPDDVMLPMGGLLMNNLNGTTPSFDVDWGDAGATNLLSLDPSNWHEYWITIQPDGTGTGTHRVDTYLDGSLIPTSFIVTAGAGGLFSYTGDSMLLMALGGTGQMGAIDVDFFAYAPGVIGPVVPVPGAVVLGALGLSMAGGWLRRRKAT